MNELAQARAAVDEQLERVKELRAKTSEAAVERESAVLNALVARENAALANHMAGEMMRG